MTQQPTNNSDAEPRWRNGHEIWIECDECGDGTTLNLSGGVLAMKSSRSGGWEFTMVQERNGFHAPGIAFKEIFCPSCKDDTSSN